MRYRSRLILLFVALLVAATVQGFQQAGAGRAQEIMTQARSSLGGEGKLKSVQSLSVSAKFRKVVASDAPQVEGELELDVLLPDKFKRTETTSLAGGMAQMVRMEGFNADQLFRDFRSSGSAHIVIRQAEDKPEAQAARLRDLRADYARLLLSLLLTAPDSFAPQFTYVGEAEAQDGRADVIDVAGADGLSARLFLDKQTHQPLMMSYRTAAPRTVIVTRSAHASEEIRKQFDDVEGNARQEAAKQVEVQVFFADYRAVEGVLLPHRITRSLDGQPNEEWQIDTYKINPPLKAERFKK